MVGGVIHCLHHSIKLGQNGIVREGGGTTDINIQDQESDWTWRTEDRDTSKMELWISEHTSGSLQGHALALRYLSSHLELP